MRIILNPNFIFTIIFFIIFRQIDANETFKGILFILISISIIYLKFNKINIQKIIFLFLFILSFQIINEKKHVYETSMPLKINSKNEMQYKNLIGIEEFNFIKNHYIVYANHCYKNTLNCFKNSQFIKKAKSPDQFFLFYNDQYTRKIKSIDHKSLASSRLAFINHPIGNIQPQEISKLDTPFFIKYENLNEFKKICFKGLAFVNFEDSSKSGFDHGRLKCLSKNIDSMYVFNLPGKNLEIKSYSSGSNELIDESLLLIFLIFIITTLNKRHFYSNLRIFLPVLLSTYIIFYISKYDSWFHIFNLFNFYFFGNEGGDGNTYLNFASLLYENLINFNFTEIFKGGEEVFYYTPGLRYFILINHIISGNSFHFYFFLLFFIPKIFYKFFKKRYNNKLSYIIFISFLLFPLLHHIGISYYQYIRHAYRLFPEALGYMFFVSALTIFLNNFKENYLKMNLFFAMSVLLRPNLVISIFLIVLIKTIYEKVYIFNFKYLFFLFLISLIYLFPLFHNIYFGNSLTLFTGYGSNILSLENLLSKNISFYKIRLFSINTIILMLIFIPNINKYLKIILVTQYLTIFWFDLNGRYYWIYWFIALTIIIDIFIKKNKWQFLKKYT